MVIFMKLVSLYIYITMINDILHAVVAKLVAVVAGVVIVVVLQAFLRAIHFHPVHKTSSQSNS